MREAFNHTADYDALVSTTMDQQFGKKSFRLSGKNGLKLRYGENPHQEAAFYRETGAKFSLADLEILGGKELSFNNIVDINAAVLAVRDLRKSGCAIIKHTNPCGLAQGLDQKKVLELAWAGDPVSAFGSIIAFNQKLTKASASFLDLTDEDKAKRKFVEVIVAPDFEKEAIDYLANNPNLRIIKYDPTKHQTNYDLKYCGGAFLVQSLDNKLIDKTEIVTQTKPQNISKELMEFGAEAVRAVKSNAIIIVREISGNLQLLGIGSGQPNRVNSVGLALKRFRENLKLEYNGSDFESYYKQEAAKVLLVSDAFFPFADNIELCAEAGIKNIMQPGGSIKDKAVVKRCDELGLAMIMTGVRHFNH
jgi:phosphoribosylaminoimidazolecarboxamide formyltransferase / IMP cyclohydrolase